MNEIPTQEDLDIAFREMKTLLDEKVAASGMSPQMFVIMDRSGFVAELMYTWQAVKEAANAAGLEWPELLPGLVVNVEDGEDA